MTVPAHPRLWSRHDEVNGHRRRYTRRSLRAAADAAGWRIERMTGFNVAYLAPAALVRIVRRRASDGGTTASRSSRSPRRRSIRLLELPLRLEGGADPARPRPPAGAVAAGRDEVVR